MEVITTVSKEVNAALDGNIGKIDQGTTNLVRRMENFTDRLDTSADMMNRKRDELLEAGKAGLGMYKLNCFVNVVVVGWLIIKLIFFKHI